MVFGGIQKVTLLDYPEKTACTVFTIGCDFACPFCQNSSLIESGGKTQHCPPSYLREEEILDFLATRQGLLDGVCISGGEPLLQDDLETFIDQVKEMGFLVKLDTNGSYPDRLRNLIEANKIDFVAMDIKNSPEKYPKTVGLEDFDTSLIEESINILRKGTIPHEFRTTVVKEFHTGEDLLSIAQWISDALTKEISDGYRNKIPDASVQKISDTDKPEISCAEKYFLQKFVDSEGVLQKGLHDFSDAEMRLFINDITTILPCAELRGI